MGIWGDSNDGEEQSDDVAVETPAVEEAPAPVVEEPAAPVGGNVTVEVNRRVNQFHAGDRVSVDPNDPTWASRISSGVVSVVND